MKTYSFNGSLEEGLVLTLDQKLGPVVFLGEAGRGRRYERVAIDRHNPAEIKNGRVFEAGLKKITLSAKDGKAELVFYTLNLKTATKDSGDVIVRVNCQGCYTRNTYGSWETISGNPEKIVGGHGAYGDAGRIGGWVDDLVVIHPGDAIKVKLSGGYKNEPFAVWYDEKGVQSATWRDYENLMALGATIANAKNEKKIFGQMPCFTFRKEIFSGIEVETSATGKVVALGESGRGRTLTEIPIIGIEVEKRLETSAVAVLKDEPKKKFYGLIQDEKPENGFIVRINTGGAYTRRGDGLWEIWKGSPTLLAEGRGADGDAGRIGYWMDGLLVLHEGDVIRVRPSGDGPAYALFVKQEKLGSEPWISWKVADAKRDPGFYVDKGTAPFGHVPTEWIGRVVTTMVDGERTIRGGGSTPTWYDDETGELVSVDPLIINRGWDGQDRHDEQVRGVWIRLEPDKKVRQLKGEELKKRQSLRKEAEELKQQAIVVSSKSFFELANEDVRRSIVEYANENGFDTMSTEGYPGLNTWVKCCKETLEKFSSLEADLIALEIRQNAGAILVNFSARHRRGGMSGNGDGWVIKADGSLRTCDSDSIPRYKSDGTLFWNQVEEPELALRWSCGTMRNVAGSSTFEVVKLPVGGCTEAQLKTVARIEQEIGAPSNAFSLSAKANTQANKLIKAIRQNCRRSRILSKVPKLDFNTISGNWGVNIEWDCIKGEDAKKHIDWQKPFDASCESREAQIVESFPAREGVLEFLIYEKWGRWNLNLRWRIPDENESLVEETTDDSSDNYAMAEAMRKAGLII